MKVLFAVNNEEISESIVKKYQKKYKEIISYKNVYYFNAILKEIQKDKSYNRIVISEDLEQFTNSSYEQMDKFIFDRLDSISDEASNMKGEDIPIILICTDRRRKSEEILVKLFGIGIYNAIIGEDRSLDEVCRLINKPRLKKEAKNYYLIDSEEVSYKSENENDVSEIEIQNILAHFKRLGKNEAKYIESYENIAQQYNDNQLKVISKFLPLNVRAVLEESSAKYQQVMAFNKSVSKDLRKPKGQGDNSGLSQKLLTNPKRNTQLDSPIIIPSSMNSAQNVRKLTRKVNEVSNVQNPVQKEIPSEVKTQVPNSVPTIEEARIEDKIDQLIPDNTQNVTNVEFEDIENIQPINEPVQSVIPNEPVAQQELSQIRLEEIEQDAPILPGGIDVAEPTQVEQMQTEQVQNVVPEQPKRGRGRPRKYPVVPESDKPKRGRGRPRKYPIPEELKEPEEEGFMTLPSMEDPIDDELESLSPISNITEFESLDNNIQEPVETEQTYNEPVSNDNLFEQAYNEPVSNDNLFEQAYNEPVSNDNLFEQTYNEPVSNDNLFEQTSDEPASNDNVSQENYNEQKPTSNWYDEPEEIDSDESEMLPGIGETSENNNNMQYNYQPNNRNEEDFESRQTLYDEEIEPIKPIIQNNPQPNRPIQPIVPNVNDNYSYSENTHVDLNDVLTGNKKVVSFVGTSKNGTSFIVNNLAEILSSVGINVAILDTTKNKNAYYIYTKNEEDLRRVAMSSISNLANGIASGIRVNNNLSVYTSLPNEDTGIENVQTVLETLVKSHTVVLIDCDFNTPKGYFSAAQEIYLVQTMDVLTIQPLTAFLKELIVENIIDEQKIRVIINKYVRIKGVSEKEIIGGMAYYNDPAMTYQTELFDKGTVKYITIPFEEETYTRYLQGLINCEISLKGYSKMFIQNLKQLESMVYPTTTDKIEYRPPALDNAGSSNFSSSMNSTLDKMKRNY